MSVIGVARELSSLFNTPLKFNPIECTKDLSTDKFKVEIKDKTVCKYYSIALLKNIKTKPSQLDEKKTFSIWCSFNK